MAAFMLVEHANGAMFDPKLGAAHYPRAVAPNRRPYRTSDGYVAAMIYNDKHWAAFVGAVKPDWAGPDLATLGQRAKRIDEVYGRLGEIFVTRTTAEWLDLLRDLHIPASPLRTTDELFDDPHLAAIGFFEPVDTQDGPVRYPGIPTWFSATPGQIAGPTPRFGADTQAVLEELGLSTPGSAAA
jgi:crotonobetainyl-CoA:carnitine CoA-transferase CaiB-like acyl-CoA transferase